MSRRRAGRSERMVSQAMNVPSTAALRLTATARISVFTSGSTAAPPASTPTTSDASAAFRTIR